MKKVIRLVLFITIPIWFLPLGIAAMATKLLLELWGEWNEFLDHYGLLSSPEKERGDR